MMVFQPIQGKVVDVFVGKDESGKGYIGYKIEVSNQGDDYAYVGKLAVNAKFTLLKSDGTSVPCNTTCITTRSANPNIPLGQPTPSVLYQVPPNGSVTIEYRIYPPGCEIGYGTVKVLVEYCTPLLGSAYPIFLDQYDPLTGQVQEDPVTGRLPNQLDALTVPAGLFSPPSTGGTTGPKPCPDQSNPNIAKPKASLEFTNVQLVGTSSGLQYQTKPNSSVGVTLVLENPWTQGQLGVSQATVEYDVVVKDENGNVVKEWKGTTTMNVYVTGTSTKKLSLGSFVAKSGKYNVSASVTFKFSSACQKMYNGTVVIHVVQPAPSGGGGNYNPSKINVIYHGFAYGNCVIKFFLGIYNASQFNPQRIKVELEAYAVSGNTKYKIGQLVCENYLKPAANEYGAPGTYVGDMFNPFVIPVSWPSNLLSDLVPIEVHYKVYGMNSSGNYVLVKEDTVKLTINGQPAYHNFISCRNTIGKCPTTQGGGGYQPQPSPSPSPQPSPQPSPPSPSPSPTPSPTPTPSTSALGTLGILGLLAGLAYLAMKHGG